YPNAIIVLTGCMVQAFPEISKNLSEADIVLGNKDFSRIVDLVNEFKITNKRIFIFDEHKNGEKYNTLSATDFNERTRAYMKIEDGCDRFCSYCIIPYSRGRVRSRSLQSIKNEAETLASKGFLEIVLVGINLSAFGKNEDFNICDAVDAVSSVDKIKRVRLSSLEPDHITDEMLLRLKSQPKFCPQFHLSLQSGCDETLKRMNRKYDTAFYADLVKRIRKIFDSPAITTDIMVGFAGETEEEFNKSLAFVEKTKFARAHIFPYSRRTGTVAAALNNQVSNEEKKHRAKLMAEISEKNEKQFISSQVGKVFPVLFETPEGNTATGYTDNYIRVKVETTEDLVGQIRNVRIEKAFNDYCLASLV
ncbi:MAG: MiaB/RimO family radical SAM methylthiotransferase, partial [Clostridia bacterium]|nr:MiaB/RimO family radical SAM methylthiotransferase [Clostridia bacterium]